MTSSEILLVPPEDRGEILRPDPGDRWVTVTNAVARAGSGLSLAEKRLMMAAISKLDSRQPAMMGNCPRVKISAIEFAETYGLNPSTAYVELKEAASALFERKITFYESEYRRLSRNKKPTEHRMRWVGSAKYCDGEGYVELAFWWEIVPHLMGLRQHYTTYQLHQASALRSIYSWKMLELFSSFKDTGWFQISIEDFWTSTDAPVSLRKNFSLLRKRIIEPAIQELKTKDNWLVKWQPINAGRRVKALMFKFQQNPQDQLPFQL